MSFLVQEREEAAEDGGEQEYSGTNLGLAKRRR